MKKRHVVVCSIVPITGSAVGKVVRTIMHDDTSRERHFLKGDRVVALFEDCNCEVEE